MFGAAVSQLIERERELERLDELLSLPGRLIVVEGEPGAGKTSLIAVVAEMASARGIAVLGGRGGELERDLAFGLARQVFRDTRAPGHGAARAASAFLDDAGPAVHESVLVASFFALGSQIAAQPTLIVVDDVQWADRSSLRWLLYTARRLEQGAASLLLSLRTGEPEIEELDRLLAEPMVEIVRLAPLSEAGVTRLAEAVLEQPAAPAFCTAVHEASGGNPFFAGELLAAAHADGLDLTEEAAERVRGLGPRTVRRSILLRLGRLGEAARDLARAIAILGTHAELRLAAALAGLDSDTAAATADRLVFARILEAGRPLDFVHPIIREVVRQDLPPALAARSHRRAAELLAEDDAPLDEIAVHLMATEPMADPWVATTLHAAGVAASARETAARFLGRALDEPPPPQSRDRVLFDLARTEQLIDPPSAVRHVRVLLERCANPADLMRLAEGARWAQSLMDSRADFSGDLAAACARLGVEQATTPAVEFWLEICGGRRPERLRRHVEAALAADPKEQPPEVFADMAVLANQLGFPLATAAHLADLALADGSLRDDRNRVSHPMSFAVAIHSLLMQDRLHEADAQLTAFLAGAGARSPIDGMIGRVMLAWMRLAQGDLEEAERLASADRAVALEIGHSWFTMLTSFVLTDTLVERGRLGEAQAVVDQVDPDAYEGWNGDSLHASRGRLRLAQGRCEEALADFERAVAIERRSVEGGCYSALAGAALAALGAGLRERAREWAELDLDNARHRELARSIGVALRLQGLIGGDIDALRESVAVLEGSPARLEIARSLIELGAALRRGKERVASREPLRRGLDLARACGADALVERALVELRATGARPRSELLTGVDSLTASERRVAELAARGHTNREIAGLLFLSPKTIERHLGETYRKLDIASRDQLPGLLAGSANPTV